MPLSRAERFRKRRLELTRPEPLEGLMIPEYDFAGNNTGKYILLSWDEVEASASGTMSQPDWFTEQEYGKPGWKSDPTYDMRRKRS